MSARILLIAIAIAATPALAEQRAYDQGVAGDGDFQLRAPTITPSVRITTGLIGGGQFLIEDDNANSVTLTSLSVQPQADTTTNITGFMMAPPGGYIFTRGRSTFTAPGGQTGSGGTDATEAIDWGVLTGFGQTGVNFCRSTPPFVCTFSQRAEDQSVASFLSSTTYDLGTWNFDAAGDFEATPYYDQTNNGGVGNTLYTLRGAFFGSSLPAMPIVGFGALAVGLAIVGARKTLTKRD